MKKKQHKLNGEVRFPRVRLIGRGDSQIMTSRDAFLLATEEEKDLILINENTDPPIVRIEDYKKFLYDAERAEKEKKRNAQHSETKEVQLSLNIGDHDMQTKAKKAAEFLEKGSKVKCVLILKGREKGRPQAGEVVILRFCQMLENGIPEAMPKMDNYRWNVILKPKKSK
jgi:translation initiation factor IF-3